MLAKEWVAAVRFCRFDGRLENDDVVHRESKIMKFNSDKSFWDYFQENTAQIIIIIDVPRNNQKDRPLTSSNRFYRISLKRSPPDDTTSSFFSFFRLSQRYGKTTPCSLDYTLSVQSVGGDISNFMRFRSDLLNSENMYSLLSRRVWRCFRIRVNVNVYENISPQRCRAHCVERYREKTDRNPTAREKKFNCNITGNEDLLRRVRTYIHTTMPLLDRLKYSLNDWIRAQRACGPVCDQRNRVGRAVSNIPPAFENAVRWFQIELIRIQLFLGLSGCQDVRWLFSAIYECRGHVEKKNDLHRNLCDGSVKSIILYNLRLSP